MIAHRLESVLVGHVRNLVDYAVVAGVTEAASGLQSFLVGARFVEVAVLLRLDAVSGFVGVVVRAIGAGSVQSLLYDGNWGDVGGGGGYRHCHEGAQNDCLEA